MGLGIDGLASGLDTTSLINSLMQIEAIPQTSLKSRLTATQSKVTALQGLNTQVASLATLAKKYTASASLDLYSATSSSTKVTASTTASAAAGSVDFTVTQLAQKQVSVSEKMGTWQDAPDSPPIITIVIGGESKEITAASESLDDVVSAINGAKAGVTASKVPVGDGLFRLQFTAADTGKDAGFAIHNGSAAAVAAADGSATPVSLIETQKAQDAEVVLWEAFYDSRPRSLPSPTPLPNSSPAPQSPSRKSPRTLSPSMLPGTTRPSARSLQTWSARSTAYLPPSPPRASLSAAPPPPALPPPPAGSLPGTAPSATSTRKSWTPPPAR